MAEGPSKFGNNFGLDSNHYLAVTEYKKDNFAFRWDVREFKSRLKITNAAAELRSPTFVYNEKKNIHQWQMYIKWSEKKKRDNSEVEDEYLSIYLFLLNVQQPLIVDVQFDLLRTGNSWRKWSFSDYTFSDRLGYGFATFAKMAELLDPANKVLEDDTLKLCCQIVMKSNVVRQVSGIKIEAERQGMKSDLVSDIGSLFNSSALSDVVIKTKSTSMKAHKIILSCRSAVFAAMFQTDMSESLEGTVEILDFESDIVKGMLQYIYRGQLFAKFLKENSLELLKIADKYEVKGLKNDAEENIAINLSVGNVAEMLVFADMNNALTLKARAIKFLNMNKVEVKKTEGFQKLLNYNSPSIFKELYKDDGN